MYFNMCVLGSLDLMPGSNDDMCHILIQLCLNIYNCFALSKFYCLLVSKGNGLQVLATIVTAAPTKYIQ